METSSTTTHFQPYLNFSHLCSYLDAYTAESYWQAYSDGWTSWLGPDFWSYASPRNSVRIESIETFSNVLIIAEFDYVPGSYSHLLLHLF